MKKGFLGGVSRSAKVAGVSASSVFERSHGWAAVAHLCQKYPSELPGHTPDGNVSALVITGLPSEESAASGRCYSPTDLLMFERLAVAGRINRGYVNRIAVESICPVRPDSDKVTNNTKPYLIKAYSTHVDDMVRKHAPNLVVLLGSEVVKAVLGDGSVESYRGKPLRAYLGGRPVWVFVAHSSAEMASISAEGRLGKVNSDEWIRVREQDICHMMSPAFIAKPPKAVSDAEAKQCGLACRYTDAGRIVEVLRTFTEFVAFDIETNGLRPYKSGAKILSIAISDGERTVAFPINHPGHEWSPAEKQAIGIAILDLFMDDSIRKVAHNLPFDLEWMAYFFGQQILTGVYGDTLGQAYCINPGPPGDGPSGLSLGQLCRQYFGFSLKRLTEGAAEVGRLEYVTTDQVCEYNALDAYWTARLHVELCKALDEAGQDKAYEMHIERIPALVQAQILGLPVNQEIRARLAREGRAEIEKLQEELCQMEEVKGTGLNPNSPSTVGAFIVNVLKDDRVIGEDGKVSTRRNVLEVIAEDHRSVKAILDIRNQHKLVSTFVDRFDPRHPKALCFPDGKVHGIYKVSGTRTGRLSSSDPNCQNFPKRTNKHIRSQFSAPEGWVWLACDLAQIEARVLAMASRDPRWVQSIKDGIDVHSHWANRAAEISPVWAQMVERDFKGARTTAKNAWVFASFYGSSFKSVARNMGFDREGPQVMHDAEALFADFWREFAGIKSWQEGSWETYKKTGMVRSLTGRRRLAPLSWNQVINSGIQGAASDICVDAAVRLWRTGVETEQIWLTPRWIIHDDLSMMVPLDRVGYAAKLLVEAQIGFSAPWVNVPIGAELEVGTDYSKMVAVGEWFTGDDTSDVAEKTLAALS